MSTSLPHVESHSTESAGSISRRELLRHGLAAAGGSDRPFALRGLTEAAGAVVRGFVDEVGN